MEIHNNVHSKVCSVITEPLQVRESTLWEPFTISPDNILSHPVTDGNSDSVQSKIYHLLEIVLGNPGVPVALKCGVTLGLAQGHHTVELGVFSTASHSIPGVVGHPWLDDEEGTEIDSTNLAIGGEPALADG